MQQANMNVTPLNAEGEAFLRSQQLQTIELVDIFVCYEKRNEWVNWDGDTSMTTRPGGVFLNSSDAQAYAERARVSGTSFRIDHLWAVALIGQGGALLVFDFHTRAPFKGAVLNSFPKNGGLIGPLRSVFPDARFRGLYLLRGTAISGLLSKSNPRDEPLNTWTSSSGGRRNSLAWTIKPTAYDGTHIRRVVEALSKAIKPKGDKNNSLIESEVSERDKPKGWSTVELDACVLAYLKILDQQIKGVSVNKTEVRDRVLEGELKNRSASAYEFRMQNISSVMQELCLPYVTGYPPAKNVGTNVKNEIKECIQRSGWVDLSNYEPECDFESLSKKTKALMMAPLSGEPAGVLVPRKLSSNAEQFLRDPLVRAWVLKQAKGVCECCNTPAPFFLENGEPYLEVHHVKFLAETGSDSTQNTVAVCPNCHRALHLSHERALLKESLYSKIPRLVRE